MRSPHYPDSNTLSKQSESAPWDQDGVPRASLGNLSRLVDEVVIALARSNRCKAHIILRNLTSKGRKKLRAPQNFLDMDKIPEECQRVLDE